MPAAWGARVAGVTFPLLLALPQPPQDTTAADTDTALPISPSSREGDGWVGMGSPPPTVLKSPQSRLRRVGRGIRPSFLPLLLLLRVVKWSQFKMGLSPNRLPSFPSLLCSSVSVAALLLLLPHCRSSLFLSFLPYWRQSVRPGDDALFCTVDGGLSGGGGWSEQAVT